MQLKLTTLSKTQKEIPLSVQYICVFGKGSPLTLTNGQTARAFMLAVVTLLGERAGMINPH